MEEIDQYVLPQPGTAAATAETQQHHDLYPFNAGFLQLDCSLNYSHTSDAILDPHQQQQQQLQHASAAIYAAQNSSDSTISQSCNSNLKLDPRLSLNNHSNSNSPPASMAGGGAAGGGGEGGSSTYLQGGAVAAGGSEQGMNAMREMIFRVAAMQPIHIDPESLKRPKRRNVKISKDPQSVAARHRREKISERIRILQRLVPGGTKMDTASMLDEAIHYVKFLKKQVQALEAAAAASAKSWPTFSQQQPHHHQSQIGLTYIPISPFSTSAAPVMTPAAAAMNCTLQFASLPCGTGFTETGLM